MSQTGYIQKVVEWFRIENSTLVATPIEKQTICQWRPNEPWAKHLEYKEVIGSLEYTATICRPVIRFATGKLARYIENPSLFHWVVVKQILWCLRDTMMMRLCILYVSTSQTGIESYADADYAVDNEDSKSKSGILIKYRYCTVYWWWKKLISTAISTGKAEINSMALGLVKTSCIWDIVG